MTIAVGMTSSSGLRAVGALMLARGGEPPAEEKSELLSEELLSSHC